MDLDPSVIVGTAIGFLVAALSSRVIRYVQRSRFWKSVADSAQRFIADPMVPIVDSREAAERALLDAQRSQLDAVERSIHGGGNGMRPGLGDDDVTPTLLPSTKPRP